MKQVLNLGYVISILLRHQQYATGEKESKLHNSDSPLLVGDLKKDDVVKEVTEPNYIETPKKVVPLRCIFQSTL